MRRICVFLLAAAVWAGCGRPTTEEPKVEILDSDEVVEFRAKRPNAPGYTLATGDVFDADFLFEPQLTTRVEVRPDGRVALPILGDIVVAGRTPSQIDSLLTAAYGTYYREPEVTVNVVQFAPPMVYVLGEVRTPSPVELTPGMSMLQAMAYAGGPLPTGNTGSVVLLRRVGEDRAMAQRVDLGEFLTGNANSWDLFLQQGDIIYVPPTFITKLNRFVDQFFTKMTPVWVFYLRGWEAFHTADVYDTFLRPTTPLN